MACIYLLFPFYSKSSVASIFERKVSVPLVLVLTFLLLASLFRRTMHIDDAWLAEYAYWLNKSGHIKSELFRGFENYEYQIFVCHKLFLIQGAALIKYFGFNLYILKSISLLYSLIAIAFVLAYFNKVVDLKNVWLHFLVFLAIFLANPCFFEYAFVFRPEANVMTFGLISFYFLNQGLNDSKLGCILISAFFAGIAVLTHLNSVIFISAGLLILLFEKRYSYFCVFAFVACLLSSFYFYDILLSNKFEIFFRQLKNDPALESEDFIWYTYILNIIKEHERFFHSPKEILFSVLLLMVVGYNFKYLVTMHKRLSLFTLFLVFSLAVVAHGKTSKYMFIYLPFLCILIVIGLANMQKIGFNRRWANYLLGFYFVGSSFQNSIFIDWKSPSISEQSSQVMKIIPRGSKVLVPFKFIFNEISNYQMQGHHVYRFFEQTGQYYEHKFNPFLISEYFRNEYIVIDDEYINHYKLKSNNNYGPYRLISQGKFMVFKKK